MSTESQSGPNLVLSRQWIEPSGEVHNLTSKRSRYVAARVLAEMEHDAQLTGYDAFLTGLNATAQQDQKTGLTSALLTEAEDFAQAPTAVLVGGFGMRWRETVLLGEYWRRMHKDLGHHINVLVFDLPGTSGEARLSKEERRMLNSGDMSPFGAKLLEITKERCTPTDLSVLSYSYGNLLGASLVQLAAKEGVKVSSLVAGALPNPRHGVRLRRWADFVIEAIISGGKYPAGTPGIFEHRPQAERSGILSTLKQVPSVQRRIASHDAFSSLRMARDAAPDMRLILGWGEKDRIGRHGEMVELLKNLNQSPGGELIGLAYEDLHHAWGRHLLALGELAVVGLEGIAR